MLLTASPAPHWKMRSGRDYVSAKKKECRRRFPEATSPVSETKRGQARETFRQRSVQKASRKVQVITFDVANVMTMVLERGRPDGGPFPVRPQPYPPSRFRGIRAGDGERCLVY
jgi:hypothetical protein